MSLWYERQRNGILNYSTAVVIGGVVINYYEYYIILYVYYYFVYLFIYLFIYLLGLAPIFMLKLNRQTKI